MKILLTGGGTGGHITPLLAVAHELKRLEPDCHIVYVGERNGKFAHMVQGQADFDEVKTVLAGKFRRFHDESRLKRLVDIKTNVLNMRDFFYFCAGTIQSLIILRRVKPGVVFLKGGFVGVPVGLASAFWRIPFITHDSDALPGLANRIVARWAAIHATGMPASFYSYPKDKTEYVGVLVGKAYRPVTQKLQEEYRNNLNLPRDAKVVFVTGGSHGSVQINTAVANIASGLLDKFSNLFIVHQVGKGNEKTHGAFVHERLRVVPFVKVMHEYSGAADVIVSRAGANTLAEFGIQGRACIVVPNPALTGGHQLKNAEYLETNDAAVIIQEKDISAGARELKDTIIKLLDNPKLAKKFGEQLYSLTKLDASKKLAKLLIEAANNN